MASRLLSQEETYQANNQCSHQLFEKGRVFTAGPAKGAYFYAPYPLTMDRAKGCYLWDVDGHRYIDFANHHTAQILGHNHPAVLEAIQAQLNKGIALGAPTGIETQIAAEMCRRVPSLERIRFVNSGTEATLHAIRLARGFTQRSKIAKFEGGYHGSHDVVEVSVHPPLDKAGPVRNPHSVPTAGGLSPNASREVLVLTYNDEAGVERLIKQHRDELACVIFDPKAGLLPVRPDFARAVARITRENGILLIFDEIVAFRSGVGGLQSHYGIEPDLTCFGKTVGGGFPVGAFGGRADIMDLLDNSQAPTGFFQSGTFSAHPVAMAAGLAVLQELTPAAFTHLQDLTERLCQGLCGILSCHQLPAQVISSGSVFSIYFVEGPLDSYRALARSDKVMASRIFHTVLEEGYFLGNSLTMCAVSLPMTNKHIDGLLRAFERGLEKIAAS